MLTGWKNFRRADEAPTYASHVGVVIEHGRWILEAQPQGVVNTYAGWTGEDRRAVAFRPPNGIDRPSGWHNTRIPVEQKALEYFGQRYGFLKLAAHLFDAYDPFGLHLMERLGLYDRTKLDMDAPVFDSVDDMQEWYDELDA